MEKVFETDSYGEVTVRNAMLESPNGTDLFDGLEIKGDEIGIVEVAGYYDIDEMDSEKVETLIDENL